jgi:septal ring factor EnvC (AmiA/AmiB activator)
MTEPADAARRLTTWTPLRVLTDLARVVADTHRLAGENQATLTRMEVLMSQSSEALAHLDAQIDDLVDYVNSDDATDAAEVQARADRIKAALADARAANIPTGGDVTPVDGGDPPVA